MLLKRMGISLIIVVTIFLNACGGGGSPTPSRVNGFGVAANHIHALLALPSHALILATHYGLFRSGDDGTHWQEVAGGPNQLMDGLMTYSLTTSPIDKQRLYVLTLPSTTPHAGTVGLYTSDDQGRSWHLTIAATSVASPSIFLVVAGNTSPSQVYMYLPTLGASGLQVSQDAGKHFSGTGILPFAPIQGILPIPGSPGHLLAYGSEGIARSEDAGAHWQIIKGINGGIFDMTTSLPQAPGLEIHSHPFPIYASGDAGVFSSIDSGMTFTSVSTQASFTSLTVSVLQPEVIYGKTGHTTRAIASKF